jgi:hypothetical protein
MSEVLRNIELRARAIVSEWGTALDSLLGHGIDGNVWETSRNSALKVFARAETFERERDCYRRLLENAVQTLAGFAVPQLLDYDNRHLAIEMTIVRPPCVLDFGKAYVNAPPAYTPEAIAEADAIERELFSDDEWKQVRLVRAALLNLGIHYFDARPSNIMFPRQVSAH